MAGLRAISAPLARKDADSGRFKKNVIIFSAASLPK